MFKEQETKVKIGNVGCLVVALHRRLLGTASSCSSTPHLTARSLPRSFPSLAPPIQAYRSHLTSDDGDHKEYHSVKCRATNRIETTAEVQETPTTRSLRHIPNPRMTTLPPTNVPKATVI